MLTLSNIQKSFDNQVALDIPHLNITGQQTTILIGPSGCGKSTLLKMINGLIKPDQGEVLFKQGKINTQNINLLRRQMGYVIQEGGLFPHLSARDNIMLMPRHIKLAPDTAEQRLQSLAELTQLDAGQLKRFPSQLSGGQRQRVALMRALILDPDLLLLDEPLGALDPMIRFEMQSQLKSIFQKLGKTVLMVTHDLNEAGFFGDHLVLLRSGKIVQQGTARQLIENPNEPFVEQFINAQRAPSIIAR